MIAINSEDVDLGGRSSLFWFFFLLLFLAIFVEISFFLLFFLNLLLEEANIDIGLVLGGLVLA